MDKVLVWLRNGLAVVGMVALGFWLGSGRGVCAQAGTGVQFQLTGVEPGSSLLVYDPGSRNLYVYKGVAMGHATAQCTYMFKVDNLGGDIERAPCSAR
jgi:hypothetical protein